MSRGAASGPEPYKPASGCRRGADLLGLLAYRYGARKSRYIGTNKSRLQAAWTAALVNLNPIAGHIATTTA